MAAPIAGKTAFQPLRDFGRDPDRGQADCKCQAVPLCATTPSLSGSTESDSQRWRSNTCLQAFSPASVNMDEQGETMSCLKDIQHPACMLRVVNFHLTARFCATLARQFCAGSQAVAAASCTEHQQLGCKSGIKDPIEVGLLAEPPCAGGGGQHLLFCDNIVRVCTSMPGRSMGDDGDHVVDPPLETEGGEVKASLITLEEFKLLTIEERVKLPKARLKKLNRLEAEALRKEEKAAQVAAKLAQESEERLQAAAKVKIELDPSLPEPIACKIRDLGDKVGTRIVINGWVHRIRRDGKRLMFIDLRDGTGFLPCVLTNEMCMTTDALTLHREASVTLYGTLTEDERAQGSIGAYELRVDFWSLVGASPAEIESILTVESNPDIMLNNRHLVIRGTRASTVLRARSLITQCFREHLFDEGYVELTPPTLVNTNCEGGSELFEVKYFDVEAYLTQSSQMYLETGIAAVGDCFCILPSYRAEPSQTRRHLAEFHHIEAECPFISFEDLLNRIEWLVCDVYKRFAQKSKDLQKILDLDLKELKRPFKRMQYKDAIEYCRQNKIYKDEATQTHFEIGDDIPEAPERKMTDLIGEPILLHRFPASLKAFYMKRCEDDPYFTESVDLLMPGVGEIVGGSMRIDDQEELFAAYAREGNDPSLYYWFTDQRRFGTCPHGGYGLGLERFCCFMLNIPHIRDVCLYPRYKGRIKP